MRGAIGVFERLVLDPITDQLDPVLVTGKSLLVDDDFTAYFVEAGEKWAFAHNLQITYSVRKLGNKHYSIVSGSGKDWNTDTYTRYVTHLFDLGITKCLVGTKFLLGEGWDSLALNTVIDLTTYYSSSAINQAKGRALRRDPNFKGKASHLWEIIPHPFLTPYSLQEFERFEKRYHNYFGIDLHGNIRNGLHRIYPDFHNKYANTYDTIRQRAFARAKDRDIAFKLWKVGQKLGDLYYVFRFSIEIPEYFADDAPSLVMAFQWAFNNRITPDSNYPWYATLDHMEYKDNSTNIDLSIKVYTSIDQKQKLIEKLLQHFHSTSWKQGYALEIISKPSLLWLRKLMSRYMTVDTEIRYFALLIPTPYPVVDRDFLSLQLRESQENKRNISLKDLVKVHEIDRVDLYGYYVDHNMVYPQLRNIHRDYMDTLELEHEFIDS